MAKGLITIHQVSREVRSRRAEKARDQVREQLENPALTTEQREQTVARLDWISKWERGEVELPRRPQNHSVRVAEAVSVEEAT